MKAKKVLNIRNVCGENIIVAEGKENIDFSNIISMNESSAFLWNNISGKDFTAEMMAEMLTKEYDIDYNTALADSQKLIDLWKEAGIIEA